MRRRAVFATAVGLVACPLVGWAAHGATLALAPVQGSCETSGGIDDCVPGLSRSLVVGGVAALVVLIAGGLGGRPALPVAIIAAGLGSVIADFQVTGSQRFWYGWYVLAVGVAAAIGFFVESREGRRSPDAD